MIEHEDLLRLISELARNSSTVGEWLASEDIAVDAIGELTEEMFALFLSCFKDKEGPREMIQSLPLNVGTIVTMAFQLGWESHKEYGREHTHIE